MSTVSLPMSGILTPDSTSFIQNLADDTKQLTFDLSGATTSTAITLTCVQPANVAVTMPISNTTLVGTDTSNTLTNKNLDSSTTFFQDTADNTKLFRFNLNPITTGNTRIFAVPDQNTTIVGTDVTQTLTNKTIASSAINTSTMASTTITSSTMDSTTNTVAANKLQSATTTIVVDASAAPAAGDRLTATSGTNATWQTPDILTFDAFSTSTAAIASAPTFTDVTLNTERIKDTGYTHAANSTDVTIDTTGEYIITYSVSANANANRSSTMSQLALDTGGGFAAIAGSNSYGYHRNGPNGEDTATRMVYQSLTAGDIIKIQTQIISGANVSLISGGSSLTIFRKR